MESPGARLLRPPLAARPSHSRTSSCDTALGMEEEVKSQKLSLTDENWGSCCRLCGNPDRVSRVSIRRSTVGGVMILHSLSWQ